MNTKLKEGQDKMNAEFRKSQVKTSTEISRNLKEHVINLLEEEHEILNQLEIKVH